jgi:RNA polymerase sigma factor (sigma-70 family)
VKPLMVAGTSEATDEQLVAATRAGSDEAFEALFRRYGDRITTYARGILSDHARAEDIVQDVFVSALRSLRASDRQVAFKPWIYEIAKNACIDQIRRSRRASEVSIDSDDFSPIDEGRMSAGVKSIDSACSVREDLETLRMAFNDLPEAQREVLVSRELEGLSYDKISTRTGLTRSAVESMLFRARRSLKDGFDDIATGERCVRTVAMMENYEMGDVGLRAERRLTRHLKDCAGCRREAIARGLDELALGAPVRSRISRAAAFLPLPAFMRRWIDGAGLFGAAGSNGAAEGASFAGKAAVLLALAAIAGGAGVAHQTRANGPSETGPAKTPIEQKASGNGGSVAPAAAAKAGRPAGTQRATSGATKRAGADGKAGGTAGTAGGSADQGPAGKAGSVGQTLGDTVRGVGGSAGSPAGGTLDNTAKTLGGTVDNTVKNVGGTVDNTVKGVGGTVNGLGTTVNQVPGTVNQTVTGVTGSLPAPPKQTSAHGSLLP